MKKIILFCIMFSILSLRVAAVEPSQSKVEERMREKICELRQGSSFAYVDLGLTDLATI